MGFEAWKIEYKIDVNQVYELVPQVMILLAVAN